MDETESTPWESRLAEALRGEPEVWTEDCLEPETLIALAERSLPDAKATTLLAHVALCARCRREFAETCELVQLSGEVRALEAAAAPPKPSWWKRWIESLSSGWRAPAVGLSVGAFACVGIYLTVAAPATRRSDRLAAELRQRDDRVAALEREKRDLNGEVARLTQRQGETVARLKAQVNSQQVQVARLERDRAVLDQVALPPARWTLTDGAGAVRGRDDPAAAALTLVSPVQTALADRRPVLEVRAASGVSGYAAYLEVDGTEADAPALRPLGATRWIPAAPLRPGTVYRWYVTAQRGGATVAATPARFYVLRDDERREVEAGRKALSGNPLALGALYARLGLIDDARRQLGAAVKADPKSTTARRWLKQLRFR